MTAAAITATSAYAHDSRSVASAGGKQFTVDGKPYLVLGIQLHNSSGFPTNLRRLAPAIARSGAHTVMAPALDVIGVDNYDTNVAPYTAIANTYRIERICQEPAQRAGPAGSPEKSLSMMTRNRGRKTDECTRQGASADAASIGAAARNRLLGQAPALAERLNRPWNASSDRTGTHDTTGPLSVYGSVGAACAGKRAVIACVPWQGDRSSARKKSGDRRGNHADHPMR